MPYSEVVIKLDCEKHKLMKIVDSQPQTTATDTTAAPAGGAATITTTTTAVIAIYMQKKWMTI